MANSPAVVVVNWHNEECTLRCVEMVRSWARLGPRLLVVDNESTAESRTKLEGTLDRQELLLSDANLGYGGGNNLAIAEALRRGAEFVLLLNSDAGFDEAGVETLLSRMQANPDIGVLGPALRERSDDGRESYLVGGRDIAQHAATRIAADPHAAASADEGALKDVDYVPGAVLLMRGSLFDDIDLFDERYFFSGEVADLCKRARSAGWRACVDAGVVATHDTSKTPASLRETLYVYYSLRNRLLYAQTHYANERLKYRARWLKLCLTELGRSLARGNFSKSRAIALALWHGCLQRFGNQSSTFLNA